MESKQAHSKFVVGIATERREKKRARRTIIMQYIIATFDQTKSCIIMQYIYDVKHLINYTKSIITQSGSVMSMLRHSTYTCTALNRLMHRCLSLVVLVRVFALLGI